MTNVTRLPLEPLVLRSKTLTKERETEKQELETSIYELQRKTRIEENEKEMQRLGLLNSKTIPIRPKRKKDVDEERKDDYIPDSSSSSESSDEQ